MGWDIQINPVAESIHPVSWDLVELLYDWVEDFEIRYCFLKRNPRLIALLKTYTPRDHRGASAIEQLLSNLKRDDPVELLFCH